jgi:hypothetical protein
MIGNGKWPERTTSTATFEDSMPDFFHSQGVSHPLERGESSVTVDSLAAILAELDVEPEGVLQPFKDVSRG